MQKLGLKVVANIFTWSGLTRRQNFQTYEVHILQTYLHLLVIDHNVLDKA